jgi:arginase
VKRRLRRSRLSHKVTTTPFNGDKTMIIKLLKNRSDIGAGTRGSDMGIDALEIAAINQEDDFFHRHLFEDVATHNETIYQKNTNSFAKRIEHVQQQCDRVCNSVANNLQQGYFPLVLSGDHSSALGVISGIKKAYPDKKLGVIWIDAHAGLTLPLYISFRKYSWNAIGCSHASR